MYRLARRSLKREVLLLWIAGWGMNRHWFDDGRTRPVWVVRLECVIVRIRDLGEASSVYFIHAVAEGGNVFFAMGRQ